MTFPRKATAAQWRHVIAKSDLDGVTKGVAQALACYMDKYGLTFAGIRKVSDASGFCKQTVQEHFEILVAGGFLDTKERGPGRSHERQAMCPASTLLAKPSYDTGRLQAPGANGTVLPHQPDRPTSPTEPSYEVGPTYIPIKYLGNDSSKKEHTELASKHSELKDKGLSQREIAEALRDLHRNVTREMP